MSPSGSPGHVDSSPSIFIVLWELVAEPLNWQASLLLSMNESEDGFIVRPPRPS